MTTSFSRTRIGYRTCIIVNAEKKAINAIKNLKKKLINKTYLGIFQKKVVKEVKETSFNQIS